MPNPVDPWREIAALIAREKENALRDFPAAPLPAPGPGPARPHRLPAAALPAAAVVLLAVGAGLLLRQGPRPAGAPRTGTGSPTPLASALARTPLFRPRPEYPVLIGGHGAPDTPFSRRLAATGFMAAVGRPTGAPPPAAVAEPDTPASAAETRREIGAVIRKKTLLQFVIRFYNPPEEA